jgi:hypothetical protein
MSRVDMPRTAIIKNFGVVDAVLGDLPRQLAATATTLNLPSSIPFSESRLLSSR